MSNINNKHNKFWQETNKKSGVYRILNISNNKCYVGSSKNLYQRQKRHWTNLRGNKHKNIYLQRSWNKNGESLFIFEIISFVREEILLEEEQKWIDLLGYYNICPIAGSSKNKILSEEVKKSISDKMKGNKNAFNSGGRKTPLSQLERTKISLTMRKSKYPKLICPNGQVFLIEPSLNQFCINNNLTRQLLDKVIKGDRKNHKGWRVLEN